MHMRILNKLRLPLLGLVGLLAACASSGRLPSSVVDLYDTGKADGMMEIEAERDGTIIEIEAEIALADLPAAVRQAAKDKLPGGRMTGAEREIQGRAEAWEVQMEKGGRDYEFVFTIDGILLESEKELRRDEAPKPVIAAAMNAIRGGTFKSVEIIESDMGAVYHVKVMRGGASYKLVLDADGTITRKVREAKAEIEIPLAD